MRKETLWLWRGLWIAGLAIVLGVALLYAWLPADGATGDLSSFTPRGFRVLWLLEEREGGLRVGDVILAAGGQTTEAWLRGTRRGPEWRQGGTVPYRVLREGGEIALSIRLERISPWAVLRRWWPQLLVALAYAGTGSFVFWKRPHSTATRVIMLAGMAVAVQLWSDAYNFQYATLAWRWPFWFHVALEHLVFGLIFATCLHFALVFPAPHPLMKRSPRPLLWAIYAVGPLLILITMLVSPTWSAALARSNRVAVAVGMVEAVLMVAALVRVAYTAQNAKERAQVHLLLLGIGTLGCITLPGYLVPVILGRAPLIPHPLVMVLIGLVPVALAVAILYYNLFDIEFVIRKTLVYSMLTASLGLLYAGSVALLQWGFRSVTGNDSDVAVVISTLVIAALFQPWRRRLQTFVDRRFYYGEKVDFRQALFDFSREVQTLLELPELLSLLIQRVMDLFGAAHGAVYLHSEGGAFELRQARNLPPHAAAQLELDAVMLRQLQDGGIVVQPPNGTFALLVPMIATWAKGGDIVPPPVGVLALGPRLSGRRYSGEDQALLLELAGRAGTAVHVAQLSKARLVEAQRREEAEGRRQIAEALRALIGRLSSTLDLTELLLRFLEGLSQVVPCTTATVRLVEGACIQVTARWSPRCCAVDHDVGTPVTEDALICEIIEKRHPILVDDVGRDPRFEERETGGGEEVRCWIGVPLIAKDAVIGVLTTAGPSLRAFDEHEVEIMLAAANQAAISIENARLYEEEEKRINELAERARRLGLVSEISVAINQSMDLDAVLQVAVDGLAQVLEVGDVGQIGLALLDGEGEQLKVVAEHTLPGSAPALGTKIPVAGNASMAQVLATKAPLAIEDAQHDRLLAPVHEVMARRQVQSILITPLLVRGRMIGTLGCDAIGAPHTFTAEEIELAQTVANLVAARIEQARLYEAAQQEISERKQAEAALRSSEQRYRELLDQTLAMLSETEALYRVSRSLTGLESLSDLLQTVVDSVAEVLPADRVALIAFDLETEEVPHFVKGGAGADEIVRVSFEELWEGLSGWVLRGQKPALSVKGVADPRESPAVRRRRVETHCGSIIVVPLHYRGRNLGTMTAINRPDERDFTQRDVNLMVAMANQAAIAIENARLYEAAQQEICERKQAEVQREALIAELEAKNEELERFTYTVSHDLKAPLVTVRGFLGFVEQAALAGDMEQMKADIARITGATSKMQQLLNELLELSRIGRQVNEPEDVPLGELAREAVALVAGRLEERSVEVAIAPDLPVVHGDRPRLQQVLQNLVDNAVKYMGDQPEPRVEIGVRRDGQEPTFYVRDNGIGIDPRYHDKVFGLFQKLDPEAEGTGVGLATVKRIVELHGGRVWVESEGAGRGSAFCFTLPADESKAGRLDPDAGPLQARRRNA